MIKRPRHVRGLLNGVLPALFVAAVIVPGCGHQGSVKAPEPSRVETSHNVRFVDVAKQDGLNYKWTIEGSRPLNILQVIGNGCAFLDYNNDGNLDILLVGPKLALYKGDGKGRFVDVTHEMGLDRIHGRFLGCAVGDYDNDGYEDIYLTAYRGGALLHNEHGKRFVDVTAQSGLKPQPWGTSAAWGDADDDGRLDLYIGNYVDFGPSTQPQLCSYGSAMGSCSPTVYGAVKGVMFRNLGNGRFEDVTNAWNLNCASGKNLGVAVADYDGGKYPSIALANDRMAGNLLTFDAHRYHDVAQSDGTAYDSSGNPVSGMGIDWGDYDNDGRLDIAVGTFERQPKCIYHNDGGGIFSDASAVLGVDQPANESVSFGTKWVDFDNDGWLDLALCNGHVNDNIGKVEPQTSYRERMLLFQNREGANFQDISSTALIGDSDRPIVGRGLAVGDFLNNGNMDILAVDSEGSPLLLENESERVGHWLELNLIGTKSNRDGQGALISVRSGTLNLLAQCTTSGSYMSASDKRVHFGLGSNTMAESVTVRWPSGSVSTFHDVLADQLITVKEGVNLLTDR